MSDIEVRPGQVWADNDPRSEGRTLRVDSIEGSKAVCTVLTNSDNTDLSSPWQRDMRGKQTRVSLVRFRPTSTGYRLLTDAVPERPHGSEYYLQVDVDDAKPDTHYRNVYQGTSVPDAMAAWSKAISDGAEYVMLEALRKDPEAGP